MNFSKILIATDLSPASNSAFELAAYEKKMEGTEIVLLHVHRMFEPISFESLEYSDPNLMNEFAAAYRDRAITKLSEIARKHFHGQSVRCEVIVSRQAPAEEIVNFAEKELCDLIVMGSRGHTVLGTVFIGSVVQRVLLLSKSPVLVVPPEKA